MFDPNFNDGKYEIYRVTMCETGRELGDTGESVWSFGAWLDDETAEWDVQVARWAISQFERAMNTNPDVVSYASSNTNVTDDNTTAEGMDI